MQPSGKFPGKQASTSSSLQALASKEQILNSVIRAYSFSPNLKGILSEIKKTPSEQSLTTLASDSINNLALLMDTVRFMHFDTLASRRGLEDHYTFTDKQFGPPVSCFY